jgi:cysteine-rich repeat protein
VCGNGVVEPGELCDDHNTASNDGCSSTCQVEADQQMCLRLLPENDACGQCSCLDCRSTTTACYGSADSAGNAQCAALITCGQEHGCTGTDCYCGTTTLFTCLFGGGNGPCRPEVEAAARSTNPVDIQARSADTNYPLGRANALVACAINNCATECDL